MENDPLFLTLCPSLKYLDTKKYFDGSLSVDLSLSAETSV